MNLSDSIVNFIHLLTFEKDIEKAKLVLSKSDFNRELLSPSFILSILNDKIPNTLIDINVDQDGLGTSIFHYLCCHPRISLDVFKFMIEDYVNESALEKLIFSLVPYISKNRAFTSDFYHYLSSTNKLYFENNLSIWNMDIGNILHHQNMEVIQFFCSLFERLVDEGKITETILNSEQFKNLPILHDFSVISCHNIDLLHLIINHQKLVKNQKKTQNQKKITLLDFILVPTSMNVNNELEFFQVDDSDDYKNDELIGVITLERMKALLKLSLPDSDMNSIQIPLDFFKQSLLYCNTEAAIYLYDFVQHRPISPLTHSELRDDLDDGNEVTKNQKKRYFLKNEFLDIFVTKQTKYKNGQYFDHLRKFGLGDNLSVDLLNFIKTIELYECHCRSTNVPIGSYSSACEWFKKSIYYTPPRTKMPQTANTDNTNNKPSVSTVNECSTQPTTNGNNTTSNTNTNTNSHTNSRGHNSSYNSNNRFSNNPTNTNNNSTKTNRPNNDRFSRPSNDNDRFSRPSNDNDRFSRPSNDRFSRPAASHNSEPNTGRFTLSYKNKHHGDGGDNRFNRNSQQKGNFGKKKDNQNQSQNFYGGGAGSGIGVDKYPERYHISLFRTMMATFERSCVFSEDRNPSTYPSIWNTIPPHSKTNADSYSHAKGPSLAVYEWFNYELMPLTDFDPHFHTVLILCFALHPSNLTDTRFEFLVKRQLTDHFSSFLVLMYDKCDWYLWCEYERFWRILAYNPSAQNILQYIIDAYFGKAGVTVGGTEKKADVSKTKAKVSKYAFIFWLFNKVDEHSNSIPIPFRLFSFFLQYSIYPTKKQMSKVLYDHLVDSTLLTRPGNKWNNEKGYLAMTRELFGLMDKGLVRVHNMGYTCVCEDISDITVSKGPTKTVADSNTVLTPHFDRCSRCNRNTGNCRCGKGCRCQKGSIVHYLNFPSNTIPKTNFLQSIDGNMGLMHVNPESRLVFSFSLEALLPPQSTTNNFFHHSTQYLLTHKLYTTAPLFIPTLLTKMGVGDISSASASASVQSTDNTSTSSSTALLNESQLTDMLVFLTNIEKSLMAMIVSVSEADNLLHFIELNHNMQSDSSNQNAVQYITNLLSIETLYNLLLSHINPKSHINDDLKLTLSQTMYSISHVLLIYALTFGDVSLLNLLLTHSQSIFPPSSSSDSSVDSLFLKSLSPNSISLSNIISPSSLSKESASSFPLHDEILAHIMTIFAGPDIDINSNTKYSIITDNFVQMILENVQNRLQS